MTLVGLAVPVLSNFEGLAELMASVDIPIKPYVIRNWKHNIGVGPAWNIALEVAKGDGVDHLIVVNDDVIFRPGVMMNLVRASARYDLVSPQNETGVCHPHGLNFWCFVVKPDDFLSKFGYFDENFAPAYYEDDDMAYRIKLAGGSIVNLDDRIYHSVMGSNVSKELHDHWYDKNQKYYVEKWGGMPSQERYTHPYNDETLGIEEWHAR